MSGRQRQADGESPRMRVVETPFGPMCLQAHGSALTGAWWLDQDDCPPIEPDTAKALSPASVSGEYAAAAPVLGADPVLDRAALELAEYFAGRRRDFTLPMAPRGTPFQRRVWDALRDLPFGALESYGALSQRCAQTAAVRAVAQAVGRNPISIFIPCHRIIGSNGALTGFGGGLRRKQALLAIEGHTYATASPNARLADPDPRQGQLW